MKRCKALLYRHHFLTGFLVCVGLLSITAWSSISYRNTAAKRKRDTPLVVLQQSGVMLEHSGVGMVGGIDAIFTRPSDDQAVHMVAFGEGVATYREDAQTHARPSPNASESVPLHAGEYTVYQGTDLKVITVDPAGKLSVSLPAYPAYSLSVLRNGTVVVASPVGNNFLHLYAPSGHLLKSFGKINNYTMPEVDEAEKQFLHRGKVLVDAADNIYYVFQYIPLIQKYSPTGKLLVERRVQGEAIDMQQELAQKFLLTKAPGAAGGINVINSATLDYKTGHLWVCMNGSSNTGVVYEYSAQGDKIREYALGIDTPLRRVIDVKDIALTRSTLYILMSQGLVVGFNRDVSTSKPDDNVTLQDVAPCGTEQNWDSCTYNCPSPACTNGQPAPTSSNSSSLDCKAALMTTLTSGYRVIGATCKTYAPGSAANPGQGIPAHMRGACEDSVTICRDGQNSTHSLFIDCPPPPSSVCSGSNLARGHVNGSNGFAANYNTYPVTGCEDDFFDQEGCCITASPILIDISGNGFNLSGLNNPVSFDFVGAGQPFTVSWTAPGSDEAFLVLDRNGNGTIDNGAELFGNFAPQPPSGQRNGFIALAEYDKPENGGNGDGRIDRHDAVFNSLRLWQDINHNGISEPSELHRLPELGVFAIDLDYHESRRQDQSGNRFRYRAKVYDSHDAQVGRWAWDVFFVKQR